MTNEYILDESIVTIKTHAEKGLCLTMISKWEPVKSWIVSKLEEYPSLWIKNIWNEEGGTAGVIVGGCIDGCMGDQHREPLKELRWIDMCLEQEADIFN